MKTKFSEILKVKKQRVSEIEQQLAAKRAQKEMLLAQVAEVLSKIKDFSFPKEGDFRSFRSAQYGLEYLSKEKEQKENMIKYFDQEIENLNILYKEANIEYEKIKHLHELEEKMILQKLLKEENKQMDEIANQLFLRRRLGEDL